MFKKDRTICYIKRERTIHRFRPGHDTRLRGYDLYYPRDNVNCSYFQRHEKDYKKSNEAS